MKTPGELSRMLFAHLQMNCWPHTRSEVSFRQTLDSRALGNLKRFCRNMASHLLTKHITWCKTCQSRRCSCTYCISLQFVIGQVCSQVCSPYLAANFGFFELRTFPWSPSRAEVGTFYPFKVGSNFTYIILKALVWGQQILPLLLLKINHYFQSQNLFVIFYCCLLYNKFWN